MPDMHPNAKCHFNIALKAVQVIQIPNNIIAIAQGVGGPLYQERIGQIPGHWRT